MTASIATAGYALMPYGYSAGRDPITGLWIVRRHDRVISREQPDHGTAVSFAWTHSALNPSPLVDRERDDDPGPSRWTECPIRRALRQHRHEAQARTG